MINKIKFLYKLFESIDGFWINNIKKEYLKDDYIFINNLSHYIDTNFLIKNKKKFALSFYNELIYEEFK